MRKLNKVWIPALLGVILLAACGKKQAPEMDASKMQETGRKICEKVMDCAMEQLKGLPEQQRKMAESMMAASKDACLGQYGAKAGTAAAERVEFTQEELDVGVQCMNEMLKASCDDLMKKHDQPASCKKFQEITEKKKQPR